MVPGSNVPATAVQLVNQVTVNGQRTLTEVDDGQGPLTLSPGMDRLVVLTGITPLTVAAPVSTTAVVTAAAGNEHMVERQTPAASEETGSALVLGSETGDELAFISNGAVAGDTATLHAVPASVIVTGALAFQGNQSAVAGQVFQIGTAPALNSLLYGNSPRQLAANQLFLALARGTDAQAEFSALVLSSGTICGQWEPIPFPAAHGISKPPINKPFQTALSCWTRSLPKWRTRWMTSGEY